MTPENAFSLAALAKINLYLHVTGRRDDGFHLLDSLVAFAGIHDTLTFSPAENLELVIDGPFADGLESGPDNLVLKAAEGYTRLSGVPVPALLRLTKRLPIAAGIGGGSADAAAALKGLARFCGVQPDPDDLKELALELGADVPVCLNGRAAFMGCIGEDLTDAPQLPACTVVLVNPGLHLSTQAVFRARAEVSPDFSESGRFDCAPKNARELASILESRRNDLALAAESLAPGIKDVVSALAACDGALMARMSGSGATCFALFDDPGKAAEAVLGLSRAHPDWWVKAGSLEGDINRLP